MFVKSENKKKGFFGFRCQRSSRGRSLEVMLEESQEAL